MLHKLKNTTRYLMIALVTLAAGFATGCGSDGKDGVTTVIHEYKELEPATFSVPGHEPRQLLPSEISEVTVTNGEFTVTFTVDGLEDESKVSVEFTIAKYVDSEGDWISMLQRNRIYATGDENVIRASNLRMEGANALSANADGSFSWTISHGGSAIDFTQGAYWTHDAPTGAVADDIVASIDTHGAWDADAVYRIGVTSRQGERFTAVAYVNGSGAFVDNPTATDTALLSCIDCHGDRGNGLTAFGAHSDRRHDPQLCASCHNQWTFDSSNSTDTAWAPVDMMTMIHKIHGDTPYPIAESTYGEIRFPDWAFGRGNGPQNCAACHVSGDNWNITVPAIGDGNDVNISNCITCHTDAPFNATVAQGDHTANTGQASCGACHGQNMDAIHSITPTLSAIQAANDYVFVVHSVEKAVAGQAPVVKWSIEKDGVAIDLAAAAALGNFEVAIGWGAGDDFTNDGFNRGTNGAQGHPQFVSVTGDTTTLGSGNTIATTTFAEPLVDAAEAGRYGYVTIMGTFNTASGGITIDGENIKPNTYVGTFALAATKVETFGERRQIVDTASCVGCHTDVYRHHTRANVDIVGCIACHNAGSLSRDASAVQGTVDLMYIVHAIHGLGENRDKFERRYAAADGFMYRNYSVNYPNTIADCTACHMNDSHKAVDTGKRLGVIANYNEGVNLPHMSTCVSCHADETGTWEHFSMIAAGKVGKASHTDLAAGNAREACAMCHE